MIRNAAKIIEYKYKFDDLHPWRYKMGQTGWFLVGLSHFKSVKRLNGDYYKL